MASTMKLLNYIKNRCTITRAAEELGVTRIHLSNIAHGNYPPGRQLAIRIEEWTGGEVKASDLLGLKEG